MLNTRDFSEPDVVRTVHSTESASGSAPVRDPFTHVELAKRKQGYFIGVTQKDFQLKKARGDLLPFAEYHRYDHTATQSGSRTIVWRYPGGTQTSKIASCNLLEDVGGFATPDGLSKHLKNAGWPEAAYEFQQESQAKFWEGFDALTFLAELRKTVSLILNVHKTAALHLAKKPSQVSSSKAWLEWNYGWMQIVRDIMSIMGAFDPQKGLIQRYQKGSSTVYNDTETKVIRLPNGEGYTAVVEDTVSLGLRGVYAAKVVADLRTFFNPLLTLYELIPYSFVLDWFVSFGSALRSISSDLIASTSTGCICYRAEYTRTVRASQPFPGPSMVSYAHAGTSQSGLTELLRIPAGSNYLPKLDLSVNSFSHFLTAIALLVVRLRG